MCSRCAPSGGFLGLGADECKVEYTLDTLMGGGILGKLCGRRQPKRRDAGQEGDAPVEKTG